MAQKKQKPPGYVAIGVPLPVRTKKTSVNEKRWAEFAQRTADALNELREGGCQDISSMGFQEHGLIFTAFRPPEVTMEAGPPGVEVRTIPLSEIPSPIKEVLDKRVMMQLVAHVDKHVKLSSSSEEVAVKEAVNDYLKGAPAEAMAKLTDILETHIKSCNEECDDQCHGVKRLPQILEAVKSRHREQLC